MRITERQENILDTLIQEYINTAKPVSSELLEKKYDFEFCPATIRNEMKKLTDTGYLQQPHTSAGRVPTKKAYRFFIDKVFENEKKIFSDFIIKEIEMTKKQIEEELRLAQELTKSLAEISSVLTIEELPKKEVLFEILIKLGPSRIRHNKNISLINSLLKELEKI
jgi:heat-inducible transcriptional repressor